MIADLHAHYPMRVVSDLSPSSTIERMRRVRGQEGFRRKFQALILKIASRLFSNSNWWSGYRITPEKLRQGEVGLALSVLYRPFEEIDFEKPYGEPPDDDYFEALLADLRQVESELAEHDPAVLRLVKDRAELERALADGATALVHAVEGGFHLGDHVEAIERNVARLAEEGVAYITLAHLFYRQIATNANALPFLPDWAYRLLFPQPEQEGLSPRGEAAVEAMVRHRVMADIAHMRPETTAESFRLLDREDPELTVPVIATHGGYRFGGQVYMLDEPTVLEIQRRGGVIGLTMAQHQLRSGIRLTNTRDFEASFEVICRHIDRIAEITGGHEQVAFGTDFDGFIKPTLGGLEDAADLRRLEPALAERYGADDAELICFGNALRVMRRLWVDPGEPG